MIVIVDYGLGNLGSIQNMIKKIGYDSIISRNKEEISKATKLILPGVGSFNKGMDQLNKSGLTELLDILVLKNKTPVLGICLGMQLMTKKSEEGGGKGLGWIDAEVVSFSFKNSMKVPHMGWNYVLTRKDVDLFESKSNDRFYFVHSYYVICKNNEDILTTTNYGIDFTSSFQKGNIMGIQCHPEKSHKFGINFLRNFIEKEWFYQE